jgi:Flp pilus assembly pilin Flp
MELKPYKNEMVNLEKAVHTKPMNVQRRLHQAGQGMAEYILIIGLVAIVVFALVQTFGKDIYNIMQHANTEIAKVPTS